MLGAHGLKFGLMGAQLAKYGFGISSHAINMPSGIGTVKEHPDFPPRDTLRMPALPDGAPLFRPVRIGGGINVNGRLARRWERCPQVRIPGTPLDIDLKGSAWAKTSIFTHALSTPCLCWNFFFEEKQNLSKFDPDNFP